MFSYVAISNAMIFDLPKTGNVAKWAVSLTALPFGRAKFQKISNTAIVKELSEVQ